jgi:hypothetical protein
MATRWTLLTIDGISFEEWAARSIEMSLEPIGQAADMRRDCLGELVDVALPLFRKYKVSISCTDFAAPELTDVWPGKFVTIECVRGLGVTNDTAGEQLVIDCLVTSWSTSVEDRLADVSWQLDAEQV